MSGPPEKPVPPAPLGPEAIQAILDRSPLIAFLGIRVEAVDHARQEITMRMGLRPELERRPGTRQFHGGAILAFIDVVGDFAVGMMVGGGVPTVNLRTDFLRPAIGTDLVGRAVTRRLGKSVAVVDVDVFSDDGKLLAIGRGSYSPIRG